MNPTWLLVFTLLLPITAWSEPVVYPGTPQPRLEEGMHNAPPAPYRTLHPHEDGNPPSNTASAPLSQPPGADIPKLPEDATFSVAALGKGAPFPANCALP